MAMNYAWQERKKFAIPVAAGALIVLIWYGLILSGINKAAERDLAARKSAEQGLRARMQSGVPTDDAVTRSERDKATLLGDLTRTEEQVVFQVAPEYRVKEGQGAAGKFGAKRQELFTKLEAQRAQRGIEQALNANLGFPATFTGLPDPVLAEWLVRLAVVDRICTLGFESGVAGISLAPVEAQDEPTVAGDKFLGVL